MICPTSAESKCLLRAPNYLCMFPFPYGCNGRWRWARNVDLCCPPVLMHSVSLALVAFCVKGCDLALLRSFRLLG